MAASCCSLLHSDWSKQRGTQHCGILNTGQFGTRNLILHHHLTTEYSHMMPSLAPLDESVHFTGDIMASEEIKRTLQPHTYKQKYKIIKFVKVNPEKKAGSCCHEIRH